jgi:gliding motility-associated protein GldL
MSKKKGGLSEYLYGTVKGKTMVNYGMSIGASVVILGALFKIQHYPGASAMLIIGLGTEALLFVLGALEPQHLNTDWSKVYPELASHDEEEGEEDEIEDLGEVAEGSDLPVTEQLDNMLEDAKIGPELIESLGSGLRGLRDTTDKLADVSNASAATDDYVDSIRHASRSVQSLSGTYEAASASLTGLASSSDAGSSLGDHLNLMASNLSELNESYTTQLQGSKAQIAATEQYFEGIEGLLQNLNESVKDAQQYRSQMAELSNNISQLNTVYGNMLTAMTGNQGTQA